MRFTNVMNLPEALVSAISNDDYDPQGDISVTSVIGPQKIRQLSARHSNEIVEDACDRIWAIVGQNTHHIIERIKHPNSLQEERVKMVVDGMTVTGQPDLYENKILDDWKVTSVYAVLNGVKPEWESQLNLYKLLMENAGFKVEGLRIIAILRDWSKFGHLRSQNYPKKQVKILQVPLWTHEKAIAYAKGRVELHKTAEALPDDEIPICTPEERWHRDDKWAVYKGKNKKATRVLNSEEEAEKIKAVLEEKTGKEHRIEFREGEDVRCLHYCPCAQFCNHYKSLVPF